MDWGFIGDAISGVVNSAAGGGVFGFLGAGIGAVVKHFQQKAEHTRKMDMIRLNMELAKQQGSWDGLTASHQADAAGSANNYKWANAIKSIWRPVLTGSLVLCTYAIFRDLMSGLVESSGLIEIYSEAEIHLLLKYIVNSIVFSTSTAITWWFGDRALSPPELKDK